MMTKVGEVTPVRRVSGHEGLKHGHCIVAIRLQIIEKGLAVEGLSYTATAIGTNHAVKRK